MWTVAALYHVLYIVVANVLRATSAPSERIFSTSRGSLKPHNVSKFIFLAANLK